MSDAPMPTKEPTIAELIAAGDPLTPPDWNEEKQAAWRAERERIRQRYKELFSKSPLYQAAAEKDPDYWDKCSPGGIYL